MASKFTSKEIGRRVQTLRKQRGYSQEDVANILKIPRSSVAQLEGGKRNLSVLELLSLSDYLGFSLEAFVTHPYEQPETNLQVSEPTKEVVGIRNSHPDLRLGKTRNILLYVMERCGGKPNVGETVLYKLLYFADFNYYERYEDHLTGATYRKLSFGPVPQQIDQLLQTMEAQGLLKRIKTKYHGFPQTRYIPLRKADLTMMTAAEKEMIDQVLVQFSDWTAASLSEYSHRDMPWRATEEGDIIDYELAFYREAPFRARTYEEENPVE
ncbi:MAG: DUF4065 domain-containing protein [Bacteroidales bacterium]